MICGYQDTMPDAQSLHPITEVSLGIGIPREVLGKYGFIALLLGPYS
jgi:hypothetical protein